MKDSTIHIRLDSSLRFALEEAAIREGKKLSEVIRDGLIEYSEKLEELKIDDDLVERF